MHSCYQEDGGFPYQAHALKLTSTTTGSDFTPTQNAEYVSTIVVLEKQYIIRIELAVLKTVPKNLA